MLLRQPIAIAESPRSGAETNDASCPGCGVTGLKPRTLGRGSHPMKVSDILRVKGNTLFTVHPDSALADAVRTMSDQDIGSLVVMEHGDLTGMLTFREVIAALVGNNLQIGTRLVRSVMDDAPLTCTPETEIDEVRRMMLGRHARYMPVLDGRTLMGVISFYDVAKTVVDAQDFENRMLKAYIRDWPLEEEATSNVEQAG
jgi:CBS domain-containing protein